MRDDELEPPQAARGRRLASMLRAAEAPTNSEFDELYPPPIRTLSQTFWTPVEVALRAARRLVSEPGTRVLDVGSGVGKFCLVGSLATQGEFFGVEQREGLVKFSRDVAGLLGATRAHFIHGLFTDLRAYDFDAFYFFNPFGEGRFAPAAQIDATVELTPSRFAEDVWRAQVFLEAAKLGARVVTYNGMGGELPASYALVERDDFGCGIDVWEKR